MKKILKSAAKINLFLNISGIDKDGYHYLESFFALLKLYDHITVEHATEDSCKVIAGGLFSSQPAGSEISMEVRNIVLKVVDQVRQYAKEKNLSPLDYYKILIEKNIPIAAGLGGGSSNAGEVFRFLNSQLKPSIKVDHLADLAEKIGKDIPFFIYNTNALVSGKGEKVAATKLNISLPILLVNPGIMVSTKQVYELRKERVGGKPIKAPASIDPRIRKDYIIENIYKGGNDLQEYAIELAPAIGDMLTFLKKFDGCKLARVSGSGSTCFAIFDDEDKALNAYNDFQKLYPELWCYYEKLEL